MYEPLIFANNQPVALKDLPILAYPDFYQQACDLLSDSNKHCVTYYLYPINAETLRGLMCIADDTNHTLIGFGYEISAQNPPILASLTAKFYQMHIYEREIWENWGVEFRNHPWLKPVRFAHDRRIGMELHDYPFYKIESEEMHEVGVGPIHAGVIEPGHFRFLCFGETVYHLEIQLGWQHRGVESVFLDKKSLLQRQVLCENIAGDTAVGHGLTLSHTMEALLGLKPNRRLRVERSLALELERVAMHIFDLSNLCVGVAYQLGASVFGALRTPVINFFQAWCGNRFAKSLTRTGGSHYPLTEALRKKLWEILVEWEEKFDQAAAHTFNLPSVQSRFDNIGKLTRTQVELIGAVGVAAKMAGLKRDVRASHPNDAYEGMDFQPEVLESGDVWARFWMRRREIRQSLKMIKKWLSDASIWAEDLPKPYKELHPTFAADTWVVSLTEAWRGEICHSAVTNQQGEIAHYKIKDPSFHNWTALALSLRNLEISDFPINNKSYNLSYCGHDL